MAFSPPVLGCLVKKGLQKGGLRAPQDPPGYANCVLNDTQWKIIPLDGCVSCLSFLETNNQMNNKCLLKFVHA